jgi:hypothetical protein
MYREMWTWTYEGMIQSITFDLTTTQLNSLHIFLYKCNLEVFKDKRFNGDVKWTELKKVDGSDNRANAELGEVNSLMRGFIVVLTVYNSYRFEIPKMEVDFRVIFDIDGLKAWLEYIPGKIDEYRQIIPEEERKDSFPHMIAKFENIMAYKFAEFDKISNPTTLLLLLLI